MKDSKYYKKHFKVREENKNTWLTKLLISIIILLLCMIVTNFNDSLKENFKNAVLEDNISFVKFNQFYEKYMKRSKEDIDDNDLKVSNDIGINNNNKTEYNGSYKFEVGPEYPIPILSSGIIVYIGDKDEYNNTIIVQGNDGVDIWYSNVLISNYSLYDYVKKNEILGSSKTEEVIITLMKDGKKISYDEYF